MGPRLRGDNSGGVRAKDYATTWPAADAAIDSLLLDDGRA
jgi:hypothetical protein